MSRYASAELFYGYSWDPEYLDGLGRDAYPLGAVTASGYQEWWKTLLLSQGHTDPWETMPKEEDYPAMTDASFIDLHRAWREEHEVEIDKWRRDARLIQDGFGVDIGWHGDTRLAPDDDAEGSPYPHIVVVGSAHSCAQWEAKRINVASLVVDPEWNGRLERFVDALGIDLSRAIGPDWLITASLG